MPPSPGKDSTIGERAGAAPRHFAPHPSDRAEIERSLAEVERGEAFDAATSEAILRWLEDGTGPCPWPDGSSG